MIILFGRMVAIAACGQGYMPVLGDGSLGGYVYGGTPARSVVGVIGGLLATELGKSRSVREMRRLSDRSWDIFRIL